MTDWKPLMNPPARMKSWIFVSPSIAAGCDQPSGCPSAIAWKTSGPPVRSNRYSSHIMLVQRDCPASDIGAMPAALNTGTRAISSLHVVGGWAPTWANKGLL